MKGPFYVRVHSCRNGIAERGSVGGIQKLHAAIVDPAELHNQGKPFFGGMRFGQLGEPAVKPAVHLRVIESRDELRDARRQPCPLSRTEAWSAGNGVGVALPERGDEAFLSLRSGGCQGACALPGRGR